MTRITTETFNAELKQLGSTWRLIEEYKGYEIPILVRCIECGMERYKQRKDLKKTMGCIECIKIKAKAKKLEPKTPKPRAPYKKQKPRKTPEQFQAEVNQVHGEGQYTVLEPYINAETKLNVYHERCDKTWLSRPRDLLSGHGCPNCRRSKGELAIERWLTENSLDFGEEVRYTDCCWKQPLPFDFVVWSEGRTYFIEFQGEQHYKSSFKDMENADELWFRQVKDKIKREYAEENGVFIEINYKDLKANRVEEILKNVFR